MGRTAAHSIGFPAENVENAWINGDFPLADLNTALMCAEHWLKFVQLSGDARRNQTVFWAYCRFLICVFFSSDFSKPQIVLYCRIFSVTSMYSRKLVFSVVLFALTTNCLACRLIVPAELLNGCIFDPMIVSISHSGFSVSRDNCNTAVAKHVFAEQPLVYYGRARSVSFT